MNWKRVIKIALLSAIIFVPTVAVAQDVFTFQPPIGNVGVWSDPQNWSPPGGPPEAGDTAIIPNLKTCTVDDARTTEIVTVNSDGTLVIDGGDTLTVDTNGDGTHDLPTMTVNGDLIIKGTLQMFDNQKAADSPRLTVNGTAEFQNVAGDPYLRFDNQFVIDGNGTVLASAAVLERARAISRRAGLTMALSRRLW